MVRMVWFAVQGRSNVDGEDGAKASMGLQAKKVCCDIARVARIRGTKCGSEGLSREGYGRATQTFLTDRPSGEFRFRGKSAPDNSHVVFYNRSGDLPLVRTDSAETVVASGADEHIAELLREIESLRSWVPQLIPENANLWLQRPRAKNGC